MLLRFDDGTVAQITAADIVLGGIRNQLQVYAAKAVIFCNINPNDAVQAYAPDGAVFGDEYITEKIETKAGWTFPQPDEDWMTGYPAELQDFVECVALGREPAVGRAARARRAGRRVRRVPLGRGGPAGRPRVVPPPLTPSSSRAQRHAGRRRGIPVVAGPGRRMPARHGRMAHWRADHPPIRRRGLLPSVRGDP